jgi:hypothetical protein
VRRTDPHRFTEKQGQYLAFIHAYTLVLGRPPAEADLQRHFQVTPPSVHQMVLTLERVGLIRRQPGVARSIELLVDPECLPPLRPSTRGVSCGLIHFGGWALFGTRATAANLPDLGKGAPHRAMAWATSTPGAFFARIESLWRIGPWSVGSNRRGRCCGEALFVAITAGCGPRCRKH